MGSGRRACLLLIDPSRGSPWPRPFRRRHPRQWSSSPSVYRDSPQKPTAGDPCARSLLCGFEAGGANLNLACLLLATLVIAACYADLKPGGASRRLPDNRSAQLCLCPCTPEAQPWAPTPKRDPEAAPRAPKEPQQEPPKAKLSQKGPQKGPGRILNI